MSDRPLRGRDTELARVRDLLDGVPHGRTRVLYVEGACGLGKTRLLAEAASLATAAGFDVTETRADEQSSYRVMAPLFALLHRLGADRDGGDGTARDATDPMLRHHVLESLVQEVERRAGHTPVAVLMDDVHWADSATLAALRTLPRRLAGFPVAWILAARPTSRLAVARPKDDPDTVVLTLGALPDSAAAELAGDVLRAPVDDSFAGLLATAGGNPFLLTELLRAAVAEGLCSVSGGRASIAASAAGDAVPSLPEAVARRLERMPPDMTDLLYAASVLGVDFELFDVARLLGRGVGQVLRPAQDLLRSGMLIEAGPRLAFRHDLVRRAVHDGMALPLRRAMHREAADTLLALGRQPEDVVRHLLAGAAPGDVAAARILREAAQGMVGVAPDTAVELALGAVGLTPTSDPRRARTLIEAVQTLRAARRTREALALADEALALAVTPTDEASLRLTVAEIHLSAGRYPAALDQLGQALTLPDVPADLRLTLLKTKGTAHAFLGEIGTAEAIGRDLVDAAYEDPDPSVVAGAMLFQSHTALLRGRIARAVDLAEGAVERAGHAAPGVPLRPLRLPGLWLATVLTSTERLTDAETLLREGQVQAEASGALWSLPAWHTRCACLLLERGELGDAAAEAEAALTVTEELELDTADRTAHAVLAMVALRQGDLTLAARRLATTDGTTPGAAPRPDPWTVCARSLLLAAQGNPTAAVREGARFYEQDAAADLLTLPPGLWPQLASVALRANDRSRAEALLTTLEHLSPRDVFDRAVAASVTHVRGLLRAGPEALEQAAKGHELTQRPLAAADAEEAMAGRALEEGRPGEAAASLQRALTRAVACKATGDVRRLQARLDQVGLRSESHRRRTAVASSGWESLTTSELRVVQLVTEGLTNRAVADRLHLSPHTVNSHLRHVFGKLGVNTRVELTRIASAHTFSEEPFQRE
ncbi:helix-turn-helix transcriptional regulator [Streptomyces sp. 142MFCol3.1]|uniref:helix-turn-helix transcriptional regulator n=1 Tax=Streptomyces sp. 142MFCol3.1 TaxID=1172179 RepID=UPI00041A2737|nr:LuxR family transcriptional regulator [Streptomyces sp. 142MFCol3.1]